MRICYTGGGTLGHVLPALSVHDCLKEKEGYNCLFLGSRKKSDREAVESAGVPYVALFSGKLRRYFSLKTIGAGFGVLLGFLQSLLVLARYKPDVLFSKGGYVSVPPVIAAHLLHIPVVIHESDATPGLANRIASRYADRICVAFQEAGKGFPQKKVVVSGNPIRRELMTGSGRNYKAEHQITKPLLLVLGGSQGADEINQLVWNNLGSLTALAYVVHQSGASAKQVSVHPQYKEIPFIKEDMAALLEAADLVVSRAGAGSLAELCHYGKASVLVPLSHGSRGDQVVNARRMESHGAAVVMKEPAEFLPLVSGLLQNPEKRKAMGASARALSKDDAAEVIARTLLDARKRNDDR